MSAQDGAGKPKAEARYPWPIRFTPGAKKAVEKYAREKCGYRYPSEWVRDLVEAEYRNPKHNLKKGPAT